MRVLAGMSAAAAGLHAFAAARHGADAPLDAAFFWVVAAAQLTWALLVLGAPRRGVLVAGLANLGVLGIWVASRTVGAPAGAHAGEVIAVGWSDTFAQVLGLLVVLGAAVLLRMPSPASGRRRSRPVIAAVALGVVAQLTMGAAAVDAGTDARAHDHRDQTHRAAEHRDASSAHG